nr:hypothetical protein [Tanacetum cinerariifolium]
MISIFIFIFVFSSFVSLCSYTYHFSIYTDYNDRHYIFLLCNIILAFLIRNFDSTQGSSSKETPSVITYEMNIQKVAVEEEYDDAERKGTQVCVTDDENVVSVINDEFEVQEAEQCVVVEEYETGELAETEELNKRCAEFISKMRERMRLESLRRTTLNATVSF